MRLPFPFFIRTHRRTNTHTHEQPGVIIDREEGQGMEFSTLHVHYDFLSSLLILLYNASSLCISLLKSNLPLLMEKGSCGVE